MSTNTHDYGEPWIANLDEWKSPITNESGEPILDNCEIGEQELVRIVKCVNACAGIPDPAAAIQAAREALQWVIQSSLIRDLAASNSHVFANFDAAKKALNLLTSAP